MIIKLKNKDKLLYDEFVFKCSIGKNGLKKNKIEGDKSTPKGLFSLGKVYYRPDRIDKPNTKLKIKKITRKMGWCDDSKNKKYNKEILLNKKNKGEKLFRSDRIYDLILVINYNTKRTIKNKSNLRKKYYKKGGSSYKDITPSAIESEEGIRNRENRRLRENLLNEISIETANLFIYNSKYINQGRY